MSKNSLFSKAWKFLPVAATAFGILTSPIQAKADENNPTTSPQIEASSSNPIGSLFKSIGSGINDALWAISPSERPKEEEKIEEPQTVSPPPITEKPKVIDTSCYDDLDKNLTDTSYRGIYNKSGRYEKPTIEACKIINEEILNLRKISGDKADITPIINEYFALKPEHKIPAQPIKKVKIEKLDLPVSGITDPKLSKSMVKPTVRAIKTPIIEELSQNFEKIPNNGPRLEIKEPLKKIPQERISLDLPKFELNLEKGRVFGPTLARAERIFPKKPEGIKKEEVQIPKQTAENTKPVLQDITPPKKPEKILKGGVGQDLGGNLSKPDITELKAKARGVVKMRDGLTFSGIYAYFCHPNNYSQFAQLNNLSFLIPKGPDISDDLKESNIFLPKNPDFNTKIGIEEFISDMDVFNSDLEGREVLIPETCLNGDIKFANYSTTLVSAKFNPISSEHIVVKKNADKMARERGFKVGSKEEKDFFAQIAEDVRTHDAAKIRKDLDSFTYEKGELVADARFKPLKISTEYNPITWDPKLASNDNKKSLEGEIKTEKEDESPLNPYLVLLGSMVGIMGAGTVAYANRRRLKSGKDKVTKGLKNWFFGDDEEEARKVFKETGKRFVFKNGIGTEVSEDDLKPYTPKPKPEIPKVDLLENYSIAQNNISASIGLLESAIEELNKKGISEDLSQSISIPEDLISSPLELAEEPEVTKYSDILLDPKDDVPFIPEVTVSDIFGFNPDSGQFTDYSIREIKEAIKEIPEFISSKVNVSDVVEETKTPKTIPLSTELSSESLETKPEEKPQVKRDIISTLETTLANSNEGSDNLEDLPLFSYTGPSASDTVNKPRKETIEDKLKGVSLNIAEESKSRYLTQNRIYSILSQYRGIERAKDPEQYAKKKISEFEDMRKQYGVKLATVYVSLKKSSKDKTELTQETFSSFVEKAQMWQEAHSRFEGKLTKTGKTRKVPLFDVSMPGRLGTYDRDNRIFDSSLYKPLAK